MTIIERILKTLEQRNSKMSELCSFLDINTSTMANWKTRNSDPPAKYIAPICEFLNVSPEYLLSGKKMEKKEKMPSPPLTDDESEILDVYRQLDRRGQARMLTTGYDELDRMKGGQAATAQAERSAG